MKVLGIDTSNQLCSVAIIEDTKPIKKIVLNQGLTHSEILMPTIEKVLAECKFSLSEIDLLVCDIGPGSFTGIRIGIATIKAFTDSLHIPNIGISSLEVLARSIHEDGIICSSIACKNDNCYYAIYERKNGIYYVLEQPQASSILEATILLENKYQNKVILVGDGITKDCPNEFDIYELCFAGLFHFQNSPNPNQDLLPLYLKKPLAQTQLEQKLQHQK